MTMLRWIGLVVLAMLVGLFTATFATSLPFPYGAFQPIMLGIIFFTLRGRWRESLAFALVAGFMTDAFAVAPISLQLLGWCLVALPLTLLSTSVLTNRSLIASVALDGVAHLFHAIVSIVLLAGIHVVRSTIPFHLPQASVVFAAFAWDAVIITAVYLLRAIFSQRFVFQPRRRYG